VTPDLNKAEQNIIKCEPDVDFFVVRVGCEALFRQIVLLDEKICHVVQVTLWVVPNE
jgi:hypothetical protein